MPSGFFVTDRGEAAGIGYSISWILDTNVIRIYITTLCISKLCLLAIENEIDEYSLLALRDFQSHSGAHLHQIDTFF